MHIEDYALVGDLQSAALIGKDGAVDWMFERLLDLRNDLGLLAEEYDVQRRRQVGNFPQAFSHLALIEAAQAITTGMDASGTRTPLEEDATPTAGR